TFEPDMVAELGWIVRVMRVLVHHDEHVASRFLLFGLVSFVGTNDVTNDVKVRHVSSRGSAGDDEEYLLGTGTGNILEATLGSRGEAIDGTGHRGRSTVRAEDRVVPPRGVVPVRVRAVLERHPVQAQHVIGGVPCVE